MHNFADRDHCLQYVAAIGLIFGRLNADDYEDGVAADPRIDRLRAKMVLAEDKRYTRGFFDPVKHSNANAIRVHFNDGTRTERIAIEYPVGHPSRRKEGIPQLIAKFEQNVARVFAGTQRRAVMDICLDGARLAALPVNELMDLMAI